MLKSLLPNNVKLIVTTDDIRLRLNLNKNKTIKFKQKTIFYPILGFSQSHSGVLDDIEGFIQNIADTFKIEKPISITGNDKVLLKCDCINGYIVNGIQELIL